VVVAGLVYVIDQYSKAWALEAVSNRHVNLLGNWLVLRLSQNPGAALSIGSSFTVVFTVLAATVSVGIILYARRVRSRAWAIVLGLLLAGALGNLTDRLFRPPAFGRGHVVDFIAYGDWFIGNVADIAIVAAMVLIMIGAIRGIPMAGETPAKPKAAPKAGPSGIGRRAVAKSAGRYEQDDPPDIMLRPPKHAAGEPKDLPHELPAEEADESAEVLFDLPGQAQAGQAIDQPDPPPSGAEVSQGAGEGLAHQDNDEVEEQIEVLFQLPGQDEAEV